MHTRLIEAEGARPRLIIRPLTRGDVDTVCAVFHRLSAHSRALRFGGAKPHLSELELARLADIGPDCHALVAHVEGDPRPVALARLVRDANDRESAELAGAVADEYQSLGVGSVLADLLAADARAAGIRYLSASVAAENTAALALVKRVADVIDSRYAGGVLELRAALLPTARATGRRRLHLRPTG
jgi:ribosomal protein S18 acetylase RimI-like enzyme